MLPFRVTLYPLAASACAYSDPRMYSSVKFLSPIVTGGLPTPGPLAAAGGLPLPAAGVLALVLLLEVELELEDELPHAASTAALRAATAAASTLCRYLPV